MSLSKDPQPLWPLEDSGISTCPFLGFLDDSEVHYSYPEAGNCCHRVKPPQPVNHQHQSEVCLAGKYQDCPVYATNWSGPLPRELTGKIDLDRSEPSFNKGWLFLAGGVVLLALIALSVNILWPVKPSPTVILTPYQLTPFQALLPSLAPQVNPTFIATLPLPPTLVVTETIPPSTPTPTPTVSPTSGPPTPGPLQETPFGPGQGYLVHIVLEGETIENIASHFATTVEVLSAINLTANHPILYGGNPAVIVVGETDINNVQPLKAVWIEVRILLSDLVNQYSIPADELRAMNSLGAGEWVERQRWIVMPRK